MNVYVSKHALDRARERFTAGRLTRRDVAADVQTAVEQGRVAKHLPSGFRRLHAHSSGRYCWTPGVDRAYVIRKVRDRRSGDPAVVVCTALLPEHDAKAEAA